MVSMWTHLLIPEIPVFEKVLRTVLVYFFLIGGLRLSGKRELAQLNPFDLVVLLTLSNTVQNAIIGADNSLAGGLVGATTLFALNYAVVRFMFHHPRLERAVEGHPVTLVKEGKVHEDQLKHELISIPELRAAARRQGFESFKDIDEAVLEPDGTISIVRKEATHDAARFQEVVQRLDQMSHDLQAIRSRLAGTV